MNSAKVDFQKPRFKFALSLLSSLPLSGLKVIELGSGAAEFACILRDKGCEVVVVELSQEKLHLSKELSFQPVCSDLHRRLPFLSKKFDGLIMIEVIEHIAKAEFLMAESYRILKEGGFLLLSTPNFSHYYNRLKVLIGSQPLREGYHSRFFTKKSIIKLMRDAGFLVEKCIASAYFPFLNRIRKTMGLTENFFVAPALLSSLIGNDLFLIARKPKD